MKIDDISKLVNWHYQLNTPADVATYDEKLIASYYLRILSRIDADGTESDVFVSDIFHCLAGLNIIKVVLNDDEKDKIEIYVNKCWTSRGFTPVEKDSPYGKILRTKPSLEDVYSTYYCIGILLLIDRDIRPYIKPILTNYISWFQASGWIYNEKWTETIIERRLDIDLFQQVLMGIRLGILFNLNLEDLPYSAARISNLLSYIKEPRYITSLYYAIQCLKLMQIWDKIKADYEKSIAAFVKSHFSEEEKGFREYLFEKVKVFSYRGMEEGEKGAIAKHRFQSDFIISSINATTYSLWLGTEAVQGDLLEFLKAKKKVLKEFYDEQKSTEGGYGSVIKIAKYNISFGTDISPLETCNHILGSSIAKIL